MNSAPVQLLPTSYGNEQQNRIPDKPKAEEPAKRFDEVLETAVRDKDGGTASVSGKQKKAEPETVGADSEKPEGKEIPKEGHAEKNLHSDSVENENRKESDKTAEKSGAEKKPKSAEKAESKAGFKGEDAAENLAALFTSSMKKPESEEVKSGKDLKVGKLDVKSAQIKPAGKTNAAEILKGASGQLEVAAGEAVAEKELKNGKKSVKGLSESLKGKEKLSTETAQRLMKSASALHDGKSKVSAAGSLKGSADKTGEIAEKDSRKSDTKLRVVNHRKTQSAKQTANQFKLYSEDGAGTAVTSSDDGGRTIEINAQTDGLKAEGRQTDVKSQQSAVLTQLKEGVNDQIVKQAGIIVKGDGSGEIKLVMKPEQLGKVRIQLSMNDNHIGGRIIVENNIVREIFESNLENLYKAFGSEGFESSGLEVSVQGEGSGQSDRQSRGGINRRAVQAIEDAVPEIVDAEWQNNAVNMVV